MTTLTNSKILKVITETANLHKDNKNNHLLTKEYNLDSDNLIGLSIKERIEVMKNFQEKCIDMDIDENKITTYMDNEYEVLTVKYTKTSRYDIFIEDFIIRNALGNLVRLHSIKGSTGTAIEEMTDEEINNYLIKKVEEVIFTKDYKKGIKISASSLDMFRNNRINLKELLELNNGE